MTPFSRLSDLLKSAKKRIILISAFIRSEVLEELLSQIERRDIPIYIYARWRIEDIVAGVTDNAVIKVAKKYNATLRVNSLLHAKVFIVDDRALIGSTNITKPGLGLSRMSNLELLVDVPMPNPRVTTLLNILETQSVEPIPISDAVIKRAEKLDFPIDYLEDNRIWFPVSNPYDFEKCVLRSKWEEVEKVDTVLEDYQKLKVNLGSDNESFSSQLVVVPSIFRRIKEELEAKTFLKKNEVFNILYEAAFPSDKDIEDYWEGILRIWIEKFMKNEFYVLEGGAGREDEIHLGKSV